MKALILDAENRNAFVSNIPRPSKSIGQVLIRVEMIALNPVDSLYVFNPLGASGRTVGSDFAGVVEACDDVASGLQVGDRVAGFVQGACSINDRPGAFAEYLVCPADLVWKASNMSSEQAASISLCALTAAQALFYRMQLPAPFIWADSSTGETNAELQYLMIYGASTSVGMYAAQLARGVRESINIVIIGVASSKHFNTLKSDPYSYDYLIDYRDPTWPDQVRSLTKGAALDYAYDCISEGDTVQTISSLMKPAGRLAVVRSREGGAWSADGITFEPSYGAVWEGLGEDVQYQGMSLPANPRARLFAVSFYRWLSDHGSLSSNTIRLMPGGLDRVVPDGFQLLGSGSMTDRPLSRIEPWMKPISGEKLVYKVNSVQL